VDFLWSQFLRSSVYLAFVGGPHYHYYSRWTLCTMLSTPLFVSLSLSHTHTHTQTHTSAPSLSHLSFSHTPKHKQTHTHLFPLSHVYLFISLFIFLSHSLNQCIYLFYLFLCLFLKVLYFSNAVTVSNTLFHRVYV